MSYHFSRALVEAFSQANSLGGDLCAEWKSIPFAVDDSSSDKMKGTFHHSPSGMMYAPLTDALGKGLLMWYQVGFLANLSVTQPTANPRPRTSGQKCFESLRKSTQDSCSQKMLSYHPLHAPQTTAECLVIKPKSPLFPRKTWVQTTLGKDTGFLHTPTCTANYTAPSMQKHACCRLFLQAFGKARNPWVAEWMMGWPMGWTDSAPLATGRFQQWQQQHGQS